MSTAEQSTMPLRVLVADDNPVNQLFAARLVENQGHTARVVANGQQAMDAMLNEDFDVVLMDISMPVKDGYEAVQQLREWEDVIGCHVPVIAVTSKDSASDRERCLATGMDDFVAKPVKASELAAALNRVIRESDSELPTTLKTVEGGEDSKSQTVCDIPAALKRLNGDGEFLRQMAQLFLDTIAGQMSLIKTAVQDRNGRTASELAHSVKGSVRHFFAATAYDAAQRLELIGLTGDVPMMQNSYEEFVIEIDRLRAELLKSLPGLH